MCDNRPLEEDLTKADYNSMTTAINKAYCELNGYDFLYSQCHYKESSDIFSCIDPNSKAPRHAAWARMVKTIDLINQNKYDYIVYIDSDCVFQNYSIRLETYIESHLDKDVVFVNNVPWHVNLPCSGFYVTKLNKITLQFFKDWYEMDIPYKNKARCWDQDALWLLIYKLKPINTYLDHLHSNKVPNKPWPKNIGLINDTIFLMKEAQYLRHICGHDAHIRKEVFLNTIISNKIDYFNIVKRTTFERFDTACLYP